MPLNGTTPPYMNLRPGPLPPQLGAPTMMPPGMAAPGVAPAPPPPPTAPALPPGVQRFDDGSMLLSPEAASTIFANQAGGAAIPQGMPPGMEAMMAGAMGGAPPPSFGNPGGMFGPPPGAGAPPPGMPAPMGMMPGQPPPAPTDPAGMVMAGPAVPPPPPRDLVVPGGASIVGGVPTVAPPPRPENFEATLRATAPAGSNPKPRPIDRLRGEKKPGTDRRRK